MEETNNVFAFEEQDGDPRTMYALMTGPKDISKLLKEAENPLEAAKALMLQVFYQVQHHETYISNHSSKKGLEEFSAWIQNKILPESSSFKQLRHFIQEANSKAMQHNGILESLRQDLQNYQNQQHDKKLKCDNDKETTMIKRMDKTTASALEPHLEDTEQIIMHRFKSGLYFENYSNKIPTAVRTKCVACESEDVGSLEAISHSAGTDALIQLFTYRLPSLQGKTVLDIGSGLGSILFASCCLSEAKSVCGIELNAPFCKIVEDVAKKFKLSSKITVIPGDLMDHKELLRNHDVVIFNNAFEFFLSIETQINLWNLIKQNMQSGSILVTNPNLQTIFDKLKPQLSFSKDEWVENYKSQIDPELLLAIEKVDEEFCVYKIK